MLTFRKQSAGVFAALDTLVKNDGNYGSAPLEAIAADISPSSSTGTSVPMEVPWSGSARSRRGCDHRAALEGAQAELRCFLPLRMLAGSRFRPWSLRAGSGSDETRRARRFVQLLPYVRGGNHMSDMLRCHDTLRLRESAAIRVSADASPAVRPSSTCRPAARRSTLHRWIEGREEEV